MRFVPVRERFEAKYIPEPMSGCWLWTAMLDTKGYGRIQIERRSTAAHRLAWELFVGPIPEDLLVLHKCDVRSCVNPGHLWLGTNDDNMKDMVRKGRSPRGARNAWSKLDRAAVLEIRRLSAEGWQNKAIAPLYGVDPSIISRAIHGQNWGWVSPQALAQELEKEA